MNTDPITVGILGLGRAGWDIHIEALKKHPRFRVTEVADPDPVRRAEAVEKLGVTAFASRDELLASGTAELVVVATPTTNHEEDALAVCRARRHCIVEKPVALTHAGFKRIAEAFLQAGRRLFPHHQFTFSAEHRFLKQLMAEGLLGNIFEIRFNWAGYARRNDWQTLKKNGGGIWNNHGAHALSSLLDLLGAPIRTLGGGAVHVKDAGDADDHAHFLLGAANARLGDLFLTSSCAATLPRFMILGSTGSATASDGGALLKYYDPASAPAIEAQEGAVAGRVYGFSDHLEWREETRALSPAGSAATFQDNVAEVLRDGAPQAVTPESALEVMRLLEWGTTGKDPLIGSGTSS